MLSGNALVLYLDLRIQIRQILRTQSNAYVFKFEGFLYLVIKLLKSLSQNSCCMELTCNERYYIMKYHQHNI